MTLIKINKFNTSFYEQLKNSVDKDKTNLIKHFKNEKEKIISLPTKIAIYADNANSLNFFPKKFDESNFVLADINWNVLQNLSNILEKNTSFKLFEKNLSFRKDNEQLLFDSLKFKTKLLKENHLYTYKKFENKNFYIGYCPPHYTEIFDLSDEENIDKYEDYVYFNFYKEKQHFLTQIGGVGDYIYKKYEEFLMQFKVGDWDGGIVYLYQDNKKLSVTFDSY